jgi:hypothetical protein
MSQERHKRKREQEMRESGDTIETPEDGGEDELAVVTPKPEFINFLQKVNEDTLHTLTQKIPTKISSIDHLFLQLSRELDSQDSLKRIDAQEVPVNKENVHLTHLIKDELKELVEMVALIKVWSKCNIPKAEDTHTFEITVQVQIIANMEALETAGSAVLKLLTNYNNKRGLLAEKLIRHKNIEDYKQAMIALDFHARLALQRWQHVLKSMWVLIMDLLSKNWEAFKPTSQHTQLTNSSPSTGCLRRSSSSTPTGESPTSGRAIKRRLSGIGFR